MPLALLASVACAPKAAEDAGSQDSTNVAVIDVPASPRIVSIDIGRALDANNHIMGGGVERFPHGDTLYVALGASHVPTGTPISVRLMSGDKILETVELTATEPAADGTAQLTATLPSGANATAGLYRVEVLLDGTSQGIREITFDS
ncbi:MAG TPA: hypothetical protein VFN22_11595 [Gemmatimonadales bacterium]|nr:hypothetical protein [Gemmatimonadales bacterium]